jgi:hypothetical protein
MNAMAGEIGGDGGVEKLGTIVGLDGDYREVKLGSGIGDEVKENVGGVGFATEWECPHKMRVIINDN